MKPPNPAVRVPSPLKIGIRWATFLPAGLVAAYAAWLLVVALTPSAPLIRKPLGGRAGNWQP